MRWTLTRATAAVAALLSVIVDPSFAHAEDPACASDRGQVVLHTDGVPPTLLVPFVRQLRAALTRRAIVLCVLDTANAEPPATKPLAGMGLTIESRGSDELVVALNVRDEVTAKRVSRDVSLQGLPEDARALVLADAADELLRASWAELLVEDAPVARQEAPPEVRRAIETSPTHARGPIVDVGAGVGGELFGTGQRQLGVNVDILIFPVERVGALVQAGFRAVPRSEATGGVVDASAIVGAIGGAFAPILPNRRYGIVVGPELFVTQTTYQGLGRSSTVQGSKDTGTSEHIAAFGRAWIALAGPLRASAELLVGAPVHPVRVVAEQASVTGVGGILLGAEVALGAAW